MTAFAKVVLTILLLFHPHYLDEETAEERKARLTNLAVAIDESGDRATCAGRFDVEECKRVWPGSKTELVLALLTRGHFESHFAQNIHAGKCRKWQCDAVKMHGKTVHLARTVWQLQWEKLFKEEWSKMLGIELEPSKYAAWAATKKVAQTYRYCRAGRGVSACRSKRGATRVRYYKRMERKHGKKLRACDNVR